MKSLYDEKYLQHVGRMRTQFFAGGQDEGIVDVRPEILEGWRHSYRLLQQPRSAGRAKIPPDELRSRLLRSAELLGAATPYMKSLHSSLKPENFHISLTDADGVVLKIVGGQDMALRSAPVGLTEGSYRGLDFPHSNLLNLCIRNNKPIQIVSTEHSLEAYDEWAGAAAPIFGLNGGGILGTIGIHCHWRNSHPHMLGLATLAAEGIARHLVLRENHETLSRANARLGAALDMTGSGVAYFDDGGVIAFANAKAAQFLRGTEDAGGLAGDNILHLIGDALTMDGIREAVRDGSTYRCEVLPPNGAAAVLCAIRAMPNGHKPPEEFLLHLRRRSEASRMAGEHIGSHAARTFDDIIGTSDLIRSVKTSAEIASQFSSTILITGERGNGKDMFAQAIHNHGPRADHPFIAINCAALPYSQVESELFGCEAGPQRKGMPGKFELADGGTLFLDEIGDMPFESQSILIRALQDREVVRGGGDKATPVDVSIIAATNRRLEELVENKTFRSDLYYRLNVIAIHLPALRERMEDIPPLVEHFIGRYGSIVPERVHGVNGEAMCILMEYPWPGNVRELEKAIESAVLASRGGTVEPADLPEHILKNEASPSGLIAAIPLREISGGAEKRQSLSLEDREREAIREAIRLHDGNISKAAAALGISRPTLYRRIKHFGMGSWRGGR